MTTTRRAFIPALAGFSVLPAWAARVPSGAELHAIPAWGAAPVLCVGHRGDYPDAPEGSAAAYANAVSRGADILKLDLQLTKDGVPVLSHDPGLGRTMGWPVLIRDRTLEEIRRHVFLPVGGHSGERIVTVEEGLGYAKRIPQLWLDFKYYDPEFLERVLRLVAAAGIGRERVMCATYTRKALEHVRARHPDIRRVGHVTITRDGKDGPFGNSFSKDACADMENEMVRSLLAYRDRLGLWGVNVIAHPAMTPEFVRRVKAGGLWFSLALVHTEKAARKYAPLRPDCVVTRDVRTVRPIFDAVRRRGGASGCPV